MIGKFGLMITPVGFADQGELLKPFFLGTVRWGGVRLTSHEPFGWVHGPS